MAAQGPFLDQIACIFRFYISMNATDDSAILNDTFLASLGPVAACFGPEMLRIQQFLSEIAAEGQFEARMHIRFVYTLVPVPTKNMKQRMTFFMDLMDLQLRFFGLGNANTFNFDTNGGQGRL